MTGGGVTEVGWGVRHQMLSLKRSGSSGGDLFTRLLLLLERRAESLDFV